MEERRKTFIAYLDDDDTRKTAHVNLLEKSENFIVFLVGDKKTTIPIHRILKLKEEE